MIHLKQYAKLESCQVIAKKHKVRQNKSRGQNDSNDVHIHFAVRDALRGKALAAVINNHDELMELWDWSLAVSKDAEMKARIRGIKNMMKTFDFYFGCTLGEQL